MEPKDNTKRLTPLDGQGLAGALFLYACLLIFHGYIYGYGDQIEVVPVLYQMEHAGVYVQDFYIQQLIAKPVHERWFFIHGIHFFHLFHPVIFLILHAACSLVLITGLNRIASIFIQTPWLRWLTIVFILLLTYNINLGGNELYYNSLIPSVVAKASAVWAILAAFHRNWKWTVPLMILAALIQPLVGIQVILLTFLAQFPFRFDRSFGSIRKLVIPYVVTMILILPWLYLLFRAHGSGEVTKELLFEIIEFRLPHHFIPAYFSLKGYVLLPMLALISVVVFRHTQRFFARFVIWSVIGCFLYAIGVEVFEWPLFLSTQWFKSTIWVKAFGFIALFHLVEKWLQGYQKKVILVSYLLHAKWLKLALPAAFFGFLFLVKGMGIGVMENRPYDFPWSEKMTPEKEISLLAGRHSGPEAVFLVPPGLTEFKWYSKRNSYVDFKAMIHHKDVLGSWYDRIRFAYGFDLEAKGDHQDIRAYWNEEFSSLVNERHESWNASGVDFIIVPNEPELSLVKIAENSRFSMYALSPEE